MASNVSVQFRRRRRLSDCLIVKVCLSEYVGNQSLSAAVELLVVRLCPIESIEGFETRGKLVVAEITLVQKRQQLVVLGSRLGENDVLILAFLRLLIRVVFRKRSPKKVAERELFEILVELTIQCPDFLGVVDIKFTSNVMLDTSP